MFVIPLLRSEIHSPTLDDRINLNMRERAREY